MLVVSDGSVVKGVDMERLVCRELPVVCVLLEGVAVCLPMVTYEPLQPL